MRGKNIIPPIFQASKEAQRSISKGFKARNQHTLWPQSPCRWYQDISYWLYGDREADSKKLNNLPTLRPVNPDAPEHSNLIPGLEQPCCRESSLEIETAMTGSTRSYEGQNTAEQLAWCLKHITRFGDVQSTELEGKRNNPWDPDSLAISQSRQRKVNMPSLKS